MNKSVMINGSLCAIDDAKISVMDHGMLYGNGIFEGIRVYNKKIFKLQEHIDRLYQSAELIGMVIDITKEQFIAEITQTVQSTGYTNAYIRVTVTIQAYIDLSTPSYDINRVIIVLDDDIIPEEKYTKGVHLVEIQRRRTPELALPMRAKTLNYLNNILALKESHQKGGDDGVLLNMEGYVTEASASNIFYIKGNTLVTPHPDAGLLVGITRNTILQMGKELGMDTQEKLFHVDELLSADEIFLTGTAYEVMPVVKVYTQEISHGKPGDITKKIMQTFKEYTQS